MADNQENTASAIAREHLVTGALGSHIERIEAYRIELRPGQMGGRHVHPGGVAGYVLAGEIIFEVEGQTPARLHPGSAFFEPPNVTIAQFGNASASAPATFLAFYPLTGDQPLITMLGE